VSFPVEQAGGARLARCLGDGGVAVFPTDTVYGVCCDPEDQLAARRLYELKGRPPERPAAVMFFALEDALAQLTELDGQTRAALELLLPGPLTLLLANPARRFALACGPDPGTLGVRVPLLSGRLQALGATGRPVMQSSANLSGEPDARVLEDVPRALLDGADLVLDGGELGGTPSTVVDLRGFATHGRWSILRAGALSAAVIEEQLAPLL
jgi:L-threonylcarbamoyladenylate synthase